MRGRRTARRLCALALALALAVCPALAEDLGPEERYQDRLSQLDQGAQKELFEDVLGSVAGIYGRLDPAALSDEALLDLYKNLSQTRFPGADGETVASQGKVQGFLRDGFGVEVDFAAFQSDTPPTLALRRAGHLCYGGNVYFKVARAESRAETAVVVPRHLYRLGDSRFCGVFDRGTDRFYAIVERPEDQWRLLRLFPAGETPTLYQLAEFGQVSAWAAGGMARAADMGLMPELVDDPGPQGIATRVQFAQLAVALVEKCLGEELPAAAFGTFADCGEEAARKAYQVGIVNGVSPGVFRPQGVLTREEMATMLWRAVTYIQSRAGRETPAPEGNLSGFRDAGQVAPWAWDAMAALTECGILKGTSDRTLSPRLSCTVEQTVLLCQRTYDQFSE